MHTQSHTHAHTHTHTHTHTHKHTHARARLKIMHIQTYCNILHEWQMTIIHQGKRFRFRFLLSSRRWEMPNNNKPLSRNCHSFSIFYCQKVVQNRNVCSCGTEEHISMVAILYGCRNAILLAALCMHLHENTVQFAMPWKKTPRWEKKKGTIAAIIIAASGT
jgi:hypothetical protein